ncbi:Uridine phosphorylase [Phytophthora cinnamomi]|uniref:Uridine phosphorylase n=1 Tax=Phytophthora cinnamomi TaxID=4785 RepID=UPI0035599F5D|nr:Uridine phosphorylase [Phytophthora cinnamomi]
MTSSSRATHPVCFQSQWGDSGLGVNVAVSGISNIGATANRENQDAFFTFYDPKNAALVVGLFDGHGRDTGRDVATAAKRYFEAQFQGYSHEDYARLQRDPEGFFHELFASCHQVLKYMLRDLYERAGHFVEEHQPDGFLVRHNWHTGTVASVRGGTTATVVVVLNGRMYLANVGDSAALMISTRPAMRADDVKVHGNDGADVLRQNEQLNDDSSEGNNHTPRSNILILSGNHSPESATEFFRARSTRRSSLDAALPALRFVYDSTEPKSRRLPVFTLANNGELHRNPRGDYYKNVRDEWATVVATPFTSLFPDALAFTRSLGDFHMHSYGVSCDPTVTELSLEWVVARHLRLATHSLDNQDSHNYDDADKDRMSCASNSSSEEPSEHTFMLLVASDGVWDNWAFRDLHSFLCTANDNKSLRQQSEVVSTEFAPVDAVVSSLMDVNLQRAASYFGDQADNMTAVLCNFAFRN